MKLQGLPSESLFLAGKVFLDYRRRGGQRRTPLPGFFIGAHAPVAGWKLIAREVARYRTYFPPVELIYPMAQ